ncbi:MAG TPA: thrombospondin type 3 repeat-containing protein [Myxococcota bacterium]|nr:thrombospondin type 3 repeat-containing protein [Myxococcota bacterium]
MNLGGVLLAVTLSVGSGDTLNLQTFAPPTLEAHPTNPDHALVAVSSNGPGVFEVQVKSGSALAFAGIAYLLPGNLNCTESAPFATPTLGGFSLEQGSGRTRGWINTSSCELAVPFDYATGSSISVSYAGQSRTAVPTRFTLTGSFTRYQASGSGAAISSFKTNFTSAALRVGNRLVVTSSNFQTAGASPVLNPGTVLFFDLDDSSPTTTVTPASPFFAVTSDPNPLALTPLPGGRVAVTNAGVYDASFPPQVTGQGSIDILDVASGQLVGSIPLGAGDPGGGALALDPSGSVAVAGSQTLRQLYAVDVRGVAALPPSGVDPRLQRPSCNDVAGDSAGGVPCLRSRVIRGGANPLVLPPPPGQSGAYSYVPAVRFGAAGDFVAATSYNDGGLAFAAFDPNDLSAPLPLLPSRFGPPQTVAATGPVGVIGSECCPGPLVLRASANGELAGTRPLFATASPNGLLVRGSLAGGLVAPSGDVDADGVPDSLDDCPIAANPDQRDSGGVGTPTPDGVGDACQCGDVSNDGRIDAADVATLRDFLAGRSSALPAPQKCDVGRGASTGACDLLDAVLLRRALAQLAPGIEPVCSAFRP